MKHIIRLIGFDGQKYWKLFKFVVNDSSDVYFCLSTLQNNLAFSRHGSGQFHQKINGKRISFPEKYSYFENRIPLASLKGIEYLGTFMPLQVKELSEDHYRIYFQEQCNGIFLIDLRNFSANLNIQPFIIAKNYKGDLLKHPFNYDTQLYLYTASDPCVGFYALNVKEPKSPTSPSTP